MQDAEKSKAQLIEERTGLLKKLSDLEFTREYAANIVETVREPLLVLDADLRVLTASRSFYQAFKVTAEETLGQKVYDLGNRQWAIPKLRELLEQILPQHKSIDDFEVEHDFETIGTRTMLLNARRVLREAIHPEIVLLAFEDITERRKAEGVLRDTNRQQLKSSNIELTAANKELEAFAYSVSHDLRSPLRGIDGFSKALLDDYRDKLDDTGKDYINRIRAGTQRMGRLIDDLLKLSRLTRAGVKYQSLDLGEIARNIAAELRREEPDRRVDFEIAKGVTVHGDSALVTAALDNLLRNSWKFTSLREHARIEIGVAEQNGERVFFVRDDGAGFDMTYVDKLFGPFQRLHDTAEFPGTGIGLAIVHRVILRHGGRIWAKGEVNKGATFYFTMPDTPLLTTSEGAKS
jgi:PAS domain S-box-containing protein